MSPTKQLTLKIWMISMIFKSLYRKFVLIIIFLLLINISVFSQENYSINFEEFKNKHVILLLNSGETVNGMIIAINNNDLIIKMNNEERGFVEKSSIKEISFETKKEIKRITIDVITKIIGITIVILYVSLKLSYLFS